jgi:hypothetical protein
MPLSKPDRTTTTPSKQKSLLKSFDRAWLERAAATANYSPSGYHCRMPDGRPRKLRARPASPCARQWQIAEATEALRLAIIRGRVSETWEDGFPRYAWHRDGEIIYEARHTRGPHGTYHAYPIEPSEAPAGLLQ